MGTVSARGAVGTTLLLAVVAASLLAVLGAVIAGCGATGSAQTTTAADATTATGVTTDTTVATTGGDATTATTASATTATTVRKGGSKPAAAFSGVTLDGKAVSLDQFRGKPLLLVYMTST
jgi:hypothetical protein